jgi:hypothetical protein
LTSIKKYVIIEVPNEREVIKMRKEIYEELINLGYAPDEVWEMISEMEFAEDYE